MFLWLSKTQLKATQAISNTCRNILWKNNCITSIIKQCSFRKKAIKKPNPEFANFDGSVKAFLGFRASSSGYL